MDSIFNSEPGSSGRLIQNPDMTKYQIGGERAEAFTYGLEDSINGTLVPALTTEEITTIHNEKPYHFEFGASAKDFDNPVVMEVRQHMFDSIKWLDSAQMGNDTALAP
jgi:hypothetical protein